ncbi:MAG: ribosomal L7Ae/L30e/S12e/Gadd45 family protein [Alicyclobacillaceae bacterium]|nr:ribosomal L7Ae/L30e/S12e/Gadd45 family protein [Alicyclobacillaceae bacterium]
MSLDRIRTAKKRTIGSNQTTKALQQMTAKHVYVAKDADERVVHPIVSLAQNQGVTIEWVESMKQLGKACGIGVGAAAAAIIEE